MAYHCYRFVLINYTVDDSRRSHSKVPRIDIKEQLDINRIPLHKCQQRIMQQSNVDDKKYESLRTQLYEFMLVT